LHDAVRGGHEAAACALATADPDLVGMCGGAGESPFYMASVTGSLGMLRVLLKTCRDAEEEVPKTPTIILAPKKLLDT
jgi:hypothetical protein